MEVVITFILVIILVIAFGKISGMNILELLDMKDERGGPYGGLILLVGISLLLGLAWLSLF